MLSNLFVHFFIIFLWGGQSLKKIFNFVRKIVFSVFILYGYNLIIQPLGMLIPINVYTVLLLTIFGIPALFSLIFILAFVF